MLWFNIGSVESMEKKLTKMQLEMEIDYNEHIAVVYKSQMGMDNFWGIAPTLLIGGILLFGMMRTKSMMSGKGTGGLFGKMSSIVKLVKPGDIQTRFKYATFIANAYH